MAAHRRVVTGLNAEGQSCFIIDEPVAIAGQSAKVVWRSAALPADNSGNEDSAPSFSLDLLHDGSAVLSLIRLPPGIPRMMHATDTLDYLVVLGGQVTLELEAGEVVLGPGDFIVDRGVQHAWRNDGTEVATMASITLPALPVGKGRTV